MHTDWFNELFGFREQSPAQVRTHLEVDGTTLRSRVNGASYEIGVLETPSLRQLRTRAGESAVGQPPVIPAPKGPIQVRNIVGESRRPPCRLPQTQALSSRSPRSSTCWRWCRRMCLPRTALRAMPTTILRARPAPSQPGPLRSIGTTLPWWTGKRARTTGRQIDCLRDVHEALSSDGRLLWKMRNGYALPTASTLTHFNRLLLRTRRRRPRRAPRCAPHRHPPGCRGDEVRIPPPSCPRPSARRSPCRTVPPASPEWESFARLILEAAYESTLLAAVENAGRIPGAPVYLTQLGGGAFGNRTAWIVAAMERAFHRLADSGLDVRDRPLLPGSASASRNLESG